MEIPYPYSMFPKQSVPVPFYVPQFDPYLLPYPYPYLIFKKKSYPSYLRTTKSKSSRPPYLLRLRTQVRLPKRRRTPSTHFGLWTYAFAHNRKYGTKAYTENKGEHRNKLSGNRNWQNFFFNKLDLSSYNYKKKKYASKN